MKDINLENVSFGKKFWAKKRFFKGDKVDSVTLNFADGKSYNIAMNQLAINIEVVEEKKVEEKENEDIDFSPNSEKDSE